MGNHLKIDKKRTILHMLCEGNSIRSVERMTGSHRDTIMRLLRRAGEHCEAILEQELCNVYTSSVQCDELWSFVHTKERRLRPSDPAEWGDAYTFLGLERESKLILAHEVGKRDEATTDQFVETLSRRVDGDVQIFTDGWSPYRRAIRRHFGSRAHFMQVVKRFDADADESHRYSPPKVRSVEHVWVQGSPRSGLVSTSHIERFNWSVRTYQRRFTRLSNGFSRKLDNLRAAVAVFVCWYNWCKKHTTIGMTPAMAGGFASSPQPIDMLIPN